MSLEVVTDEHEGKAVDVVMHAAAWQQPITLGWLERCQNVCKLLKRTERATHLLRIVDANGELETWHAGRAGVSIAAALERLALEHAIVRDAVVLVPLTSRTYFAEMSGALVQAEGALFDKAILTKVRDWHQANRRTVQISLTGGRQCDIPGTEKLDIDLNLDGFRFSRASEGMLRAKLVRMRDCVLLLTLCCILVSTWIGFKWLSQRTHLEIVDPIDLVDHYEPKVRIPQAGPTLAMLAAVLANRDQAVWSTEVLGRLVFDPETQVLSLFHQASEQAVVAHRIEYGSLPRMADSSIELSALRVRIKQLLQDSKLEAVWEDVFDTGNTKRGQRFTVILETFPTLQLIDLADIFKSLPIRLVSVECTLGFGNLQECTVQFAIQGKAAQS